MLVGTPVPATALSIASQPQTSSHGGLTLPAWAMTATVSTTSAPLPTPEAQAPAPSAVSVAPSSTDPDDIRPLQLAPDAAALRSTSMPSGNGLTVRPLDGGSGGTAQPPIITELDVINGIQGQAPDYTYNANGVPVGAPMAFQVLSPSQDLHIESITWSGGTDYAGYFSGDADTQPAPQTMSVTTGVDTHGNVYAFYTDASEEPYTVSVTVTYFEDPGNPHWSSVVFTSHRPTQASLSVVDPGEVWFRNIPQTGEVGLQYENGITLLATTEIGAFEGDFMFMQTVDSTWTQTDQNGVQQTLTNAGGGQNLDDGYIGFYEPIGMPIDGTNSVSWFPTPPNTFEQHTTDDDPAFTVLDNYQALSANDRFTTYLMYRPMVGGVWIALSRADWIFAGSAQSPWPADYQVSTPRPVITTPQLGGEFPSWTGRTSDQHWQ